MKNLVLFLVLSMFILPTIAQEKFSIPVMSDEEKIISLAGAWNSVNLYLISHAKSLGKSVEDVATFTSDLYISGMDKSIGFEGYAKLLIRGWVGTAPTGKVEIIEQTENKIVIKVTDFFNQLKVKGTLSNVSYAEYLKYFEFRGNRIFGVLGGTYSIIDTNEALIITMQKK